MGLPDKVKLTPEEKSYIDRTVLSAVEKLRQGYALSDVVVWLRSKYQKEFPIKIRKIEHRRPESVKDETLVEEPA